MLAKRILLPAILTGLFFFLAWPPISVTPLLFVAFVPLLYSAQQHAQRYHFLLTLFAGLFLWNLGTTWWIWNSTLIGGWLAIIANSVLMCIPWLGYRWLYNKTHRTTGYLLGPQLALAYPGQRFCHPNPVGAVVCFYRQQRRNTLGVSGQHTCV